MPDPRSPWRKPLEVVLFLLLYAVSILAYLILSPTGIEGSSEDFLPYFAVACLVFGVLVKEWRALAYPAAYFALLLLTSEPSDEAAEIGLAGAGAAGMGVLLGQWKGKHPGSRKSAASRATQ